MSKNISSDNNNYIVATIRPWNIKQFFLKTKNLPGNWFLIDDPLKLSIEEINLINPRYIFFPHWNEIISEEIIENYECVCFHETDVPYGRGGSPIQNLIVRGEKETKLTALRMIKEIDAGPIYYQENLSLLGLAEEIFVRSSILVYKIIEKIILNNPKPRDQEGEIVFFKRRKPEDSKIPYSISSLNELFDFIRMLDAQDYPAAFIDYEKFRIEFSRPAIRTQNISASVTIKLLNEDEYK